MPEQPTPTGDAWPCPRCGGAIFTTMGNAHSCPDTGFFVRTASSTSAPPEAAVPSPSVEEARKALYWKLIHSRSHMQANREAAEAFKVYDEAVRREEQQRWGGVDWQKARGDAIERTLASALARAATADGDAVYWKNQSEAGWHTASLYADERNEERTRAEQAEARVQGLEEVVAAAKEWDAAQRSVTFDGPGISAAKDRLRAALLAPAPGDGALPPDARTNGGRS